MKKRLSALLLLLLAALYSYLQKPATSGDTPAAASASAIARAYRDHQSNLQVSGSGVVQALLPDDRSGSRHQKFLLRLPDGQTLLIAHNIDLAPRIPALRKGDTVQFCGEYEWNEKGGVVHWTHHDPAARHTPGWLLHKGRKYQ